MNPNSEIRHFTISMRETSENSETTRRQTSEDHAHGVELRNGVQG